FVGDNDSDIFFSLASRLRIHATPLLANVNRVSNRAFSCLFVFKRCGFSSFRLTASSLRSWYKSRSNSTIRACISAADNVPFSSLFFFFAIVTPFPVGRQIWFASAILPLRASTLPALLRGSRWPLQTRCGQAVRKPPSGPELLYQFLGAFPLVF